MDRMLTVFLNIENATGIAEATLEVIINEDIAEELLENDALDEQNFPDTDEVLGLVQSVILSHLKDFMIIQGNTIIAIKTAYGAD